MSVQMVHSRCKMVGVEEEISELAYMIRRRRGMEADASAHKGEVVV